MHTRIVAIVGGERKTSLTFLQYRDVLRKEIDRVGSSCFSNRNFFRKKGSLHTVSVRKLRNES